MSTAQMTGPSLTFAAFSATAIAVLAGALAAAILGC